MTPPSEVLDIEVVEVPSGAVVELVHEPADPMEGATVTGVLTDADGTAPPTSSRDYVHTQSAPAASWVIVHGLGRYPQVTVVDVTGQRVLSDLAYGGPNSLTVTHHGPLAGTAYLA